MLVAAPEVVQPLKVPVSKPPLVIPLPGAGVGVGGMGVGVGGVVVGVGVGPGGGVGVGVGVPPPQLGNLKEPMRVLQLNAPLEGMYSLVYQKVQPSAGSIVMAL